jgi:hypothetical protein
VKSTGLVFCIVPLLCEGINLLEGGEVKGKQDSGVSKPVTSHSKAETSCQQRTELSTPHVWTHMDSSVPPVHENCLLRLCHHIVIEL